MPLFIQCSRLFVNILSIRVAVVEVRRVGLEIKGYLTITPRGRVGYEMIDSQRGA